MRKTYEFAAFRLDPARRRLDKNGESVALHAKAFDALVYLLEHAGEPVSRRALTEALWPKRVVEENNLTQAISALRRALGDECIVTLAGRGYQFIAEVRTVEGNVNAEAAATAAPAELPSDGKPPSAATVPTEAATVSDARPRRARLVPRVAAGLAVAAILATAAYFLVTGEPEPVTVLVLPFQSRSQDSEHQAFAYGLTDELISRLRGLSRLRVMGPATSFALRASTRDVPEIAADLGVQYVLEGTVDRDADLWRARGQLSDATGFSVWNFDSAAGSFSDIRDEIVVGVADELGAAIRLETTPPRGTDDRAAYALYLAALEGVRGDEPQPALERVDLALQRDERFAAAWSMRANLLTIIGANLPADEREAHFDLAQDAADRAILLAPDEGLSYTARAVVRGVRGDWSGANSDYQKALALGYTDVSAWPIFLLSVGRVASARETLERRFYDDPLNANALLFLMLSQELSGQPDAADELDALRRSLDYPGTLVRSASTWIRLGRDDESARLEDVNARDAQFADPALAPEERLERLRRAAAQPEYAYAAARANFAIWAARLDDTPLALALLEEAVTEQALLWYLAWLPVFDGVRQTTEFKDLVRKAGLVEHWRETGWPDVCRPLGQSDFACD